MDRLTRQHSGWRDALLALLVLGLIFLNFGHQSAVFAAGGRVVVTAAAVCGDPIDPHAGEHFACHACRPDVMALPPAPAGVESVCPGETVVYDHKAGTIPGLAAVFGLGARGPPAMA